MTESRYHGEAAAEEKDPFLVRWSQRKAQARREDPLPDEVPEQPAAVAEEAESEASQPIDPHSGKPYEELTDDDMPPLESLHADSDVSMFMARNISPALRRAALRQIFRAPKFNKIDLCAEYAGDYTTWEPLGDVVPHDLKSALVREAERARRKLAEQEAAAVDADEPHDDGTDLEDGVAPEGVEPENVAADSARDEGVEGNDVPGREGAG